MYIFLCMICMFNHLKISPFNQQMNCSFTLHLQLIVLKNICWMQCCTLNLHSTSFRIICSHNMDTGDKTVSSGPSSSTWVNKH